MGVAMSERDIVAELDQRIGSLGGNLGPGEVVVFDADAIEMLQRARDEIVALRAALYERNATSVGLENAYACVQITRAEALNEVLQLACLGDDARRLVAEMLRASKDKP